jgi:YD repeat-containing protein
MVMATDTDRLMDGPPVPADATVFTFRRGATWFILLALLFALAEAVVLLVEAWFTPDPTTRMTQIPEGVFLALVAELNWRFFRSSWHRIAVNAEGIWSVRLRNTRFLAWRNVAHVLANDAMQRLELADASGLTAIQVEYQLKDFERLRDFILSHTTESAQVQASGVGAFRRSWEYKIIYATIASASLFVAWFVYRHVTGHVFLLPVALGATALVLFFLDPVSLVIDHDRISIKYAGYQRTILFSSISEITLSDRRYRGNVWAGVLIQRKAGGPIRLSRFRGGSVALYEALQAASRAASPAQGSPGTAGTVAQNAAASTTQQAPFARSGSPRTARAIGMAFVLAVVAAAAMFVSVTRGNFRWSIGREVSRDYSEQSAYPKHVGLAAEPNELKGTGRIYLVQMGEHRDPYSIEDFAKWLRAKYALDVQVLPAMAIDPSAWDARRHQFVAEQLEAQLKQKHADLAADHDAYLIGFTDGDMYSTRQMWSSTFTQRDLMRAAIISSDGMGDTAAQRADLGAQGAVDRFQARIKRILLKDVAVLYWHLPVNDDPTSLLHNTLDPDLPSEEIYESDVNPALSPQGELVDEPCIFFTYSSKSGLQPLPGPLIRGCGEVQDPMEDESTELFELDLRLGLLIDKHTDLYLSDTIPIEFQRVTRDGEQGRDPFGVSGWDNYDEFLGSADNIQIFVERADGGRDELMRTPRWMPVQALVKYVGGPSEMAFEPGSGISGLFRASSFKRVWKYEMAWHQLPFEHYDVRRFNGGVKTYLPCDSPDVNCSIVGYQDSQGRELKFERDSKRHLSRLTSPNGKWVGVGSAPDGRILAIDDSDGRTVLYKYDAANRLVGVTYPSGEIYHYEYDDARHMLAFSVSADAQSEPHILLRNEYENGLLTKQTLADGRVYTYSYDSSNAETIHHATVEAPDGTSYSLEIGDDSSILHETPNLGGREK